MNPNNQTKENEMQEEPTTTTIQTTVDEDSMMFVMNIDSEDDGRAIAIRPDLLCLMNIDAIEQPIVGFNFPSLDFAKEVLAQLIATVMMWDKTSADRIELPKPLLKPVVNGLILPGVKP